VTLEDGIILVAQGGLLVLTACSARYAERACRRAQEIERRVHEIIEADDD
jgi:metal-dependent hydrolase (beta-lactamase superfamily II)